VVIARQEELAFVGMPDGERPVAQQVIWAFFAPFQVGAQDQLAVGRGGALAVGNGEEITEFGAVVDARLGGDRQAGVLHPAGQPLVQGFGRVEEQALAQAAARVVPESATVRSPVGQGRLHLL